MKIEIIENGKYIIKNKGVYFLIEKYHISGSYYDCYGIYTDYCNDKQNLLELETDDLEDITEKSTLEDALYFISNYDEED